MLQRITPFLWFDNQAEEAATFYTSIFRNATMGTINHFGEAGPGPSGATMVVQFTLDGQEFLALNGGPQYRFTEALSLFVTCANQDEVDYYWDKLTADGGEPGPCGWLKDKFGVSWQVFPEVWFDMLKTSDPEQGNRIMQTMFKMSKIDLATLQAAYEDDASTGR